MTEVYQKRGSIVRWENGRVVSVTENGVAVEVGERFECRPGDGERLPLLDPGEVVAAARTVHALIAEPVRIERLVVTQGTAEHRFGDAEWRDESARVHLSLTYGEHRALIDLGSLDVRPIETVAHALARCEASERPAPPRLRLAPAVTAAILPSLAGLAPPNVTLLQSSGGVDGKGTPVREVPITRGPWPNWYRPSYRLRPVRMPIDLRLECPVREIDSDRPIAIALLAPPSGLVVQALVVDARRVYPSTVRITRIDAVAEEQVWYPYGAGSFGAEMML